VGFEEVVALLLTQVLEKLGPPGRKGGMVRPDAGKKEKKRRGMEPSIVP